MNAFYKSLFTLILITFIYDAVAQSRETQDLQKDWISSFNQSGDLQSFYREASGILQESKLITGSDNIGKKWLEFRGRQGTITEYKRLETIQLRETSKFELGEYLMEKGSRYYTIIGWRNNNGWYKEIEVTHIAVDPGADETDEIKLLRDSWQKLANDHRPDLIGKELYTDGGYYFNRGRVYSNRDIADVYSYMNPESFRIALEGLSTTIVNEEIAYDIGSFQTNGKGLYILIWIKKENKWKLLLDFNF
ncbi:MAG: hypothetical protein AAGA02_13025 [Bacteroidota bacterium]